MQGQQFGGNFISEKEMNLYLTKYLGHKKHLPKNYSSPEGLKVYLSAVRSELMDPRNKNSIPCNLPEEEIQALQQFQHLQRNRKLVIKHVIKVQV